MAQMSQMIHSGFSAYFIIHYSLFDYISFLYIMFGLRQCQIMES